MAGIADVVDIQGEVDILQGVMFLRSIVNVSGISIWGISMVSRGIYMKGRVDEVDIWG